jgi:hypothetical protein
MALVDKPDLHGHLRRRDPLKQQSFGVTNANLVQVSMRWHSVSQRKLPRSVHPGHSSNIRYHADRDILAVTAFK